VLALVIRAGLKEPERWQQMKARAAQTGEQLGGYGALFADPRKVETSLGSFGLQRVTELDVQNEAAALASCQEQDMQDCWKTITKLVLTAIRKRLDAGAVIDGVAIRAGDTAVYRVAKTLLDEARQSAG
jgi:hypothetical protein